MRERVRRLLQSTPTSPTEKFKWSDRRSVREQVRSGIGKAVGLIAAFVVLVGAMGSVSVLFDPSVSRGGGEIAVSCAVLLFATALMFATANLWSPYVTGFFFGPAIFKIVAVLFVGSDAYYSSHGVSRTQVLEFLAYAVAIVALTIRFVGRRPAPTTVIDRIALTFFAIATLTQVVIPYRFPPWPLGSGVAALGVAWIAFRRQRFNKRLAKTNSRKPHSDNMHAEASR